MNAGMVVSVNVAFDGAVLNGSYTNVVFSPSSTTASFGYTTSSISIPANSAAFTVQFSFSARILCATPYPVSTGAVELLLTFSDDGTVMRHTIPAQPFVVGFDVAAPWVTPTYTDKSWGMAVPAVSGCASVNVSVLVLPVALPLYSSRLTNVLSGGVSGPHCQVRRSPLSGAAQGIVAAARASACCSDCVMG